MMSQIWEWLDFKNATYKVMKVIRYDHFWTREQRRVRRPLKVGKKIAVSIPRKKFII
jgi:hypothetical protein